MCACRNLNQNQLTTLPKDSLWSIASLSTLCASCSLRSLFTGVHCSLNSMCESRARRLRQGRSEHVRVRVASCAGGCRRTGGRATAGSGGWRGGCGRGGRRWRRMRRACSARRLRCSAARSWPTSPTSTSSARVRRRTPLPYPLLVTRTSHSLHSSLLIANYSLHYSVLTIIIINQ